MRKIFLIVLFSVFYFSFTGVEAQSLYLTKEELSQFNGLNETKAYIAVSGIIYDVTGAPGWKNGKHKGFQAGQDVTDQIKKSPHGIKVLEKRTIVGKLVLGLTLKELEKFNGQNGERAYVAVDGLIYDVTEKWKNGMHKGNKAGRDMSEKIKKSPHGNKVLENLTIVGKLVK